MKTALYPRKKSTRQVRTTGIFHLIILNAGSMVRVIGIRYLAAWVVLFVVLQVLVRRVLGLVTCSHAPSSPSSSSTSSFSHF
jgi:hypothetical protein